MGQELDSQAESLSINAVCAFPRPRASQHRRLAICISDMHNGY